MYDELVKRLRASVDGRNEKCDGCPYEEDYPCCVDCLDKMHKQAANAIEELSKDRDKWKATAQEERDAYWHWFDQYQKDAPRWISVEERLPEIPKGEIFSKEVYVTDGEYIEHALRMADYDGKEAWTYCGIGKITHWCERIPLPEPPKEETE